MPTFMDAPPLHTQRAHYDPPHRGDCKAATVAVSHRSVGPDHVKAIDQNFQVSGMALRVRLGGFEIWNVHWAKPGQNGYHYIVDENGHDVRAMTHAEANKPIAKWATKDVYRWRAGPSIHSERPRTFEECVVDAKAVGVVVTPELKSNYFRKLKVARYLVAICQRHNYPVWAMALFGSMPYCEGKCWAIRTAVREVGGRGGFCAIFGRFQGLRAKFRRQVKTWRIRPNHSW